jgi:hypothetical protein
MIISDPKRTEGKKSHDTVPFIKVGRPELRHDIYSSLKKSYNFTNFICENYLEDTSLRPNKMRYQQYESLFSSHNRSKSNLKT